ncbi:dihydrofolate reductase [Bacteroides heparinolyticus]|uniref:Dihydrofolate reductase n=1 Tax=Prevotella heparinolytica TaxID=28113 RepID=A0A4R2MAV3_9BACE|nr:MULTISPECIES: dihydrofolate reductase family protein [Bacteroidales]ATR95025.1 riboflavin biosynthesis protein RibD [Porphyromonas gingivalis]ATR96220.1 riboflavin biosynthesis protein RibD [Porphyromonas gingivalis]TCO95962.1 dihydrofolate reductase [Bacteroides heparinolyticus]
MKKIKLYIAVSADGYIAPPDGDLSWLVNHPMPSKEEHQDFLNSVDTVLLDGNMYSNLVCMDILWPYKGKEVYVVSPHPVLAKYEVKFITEKVSETIADLKRARGKDIWLAGGADLISLLRDNGLIDEMIIIYTPEVFDKGIALFSEDPEKSAWKLVESISYNDIAVRKDTLSQE